MFGALPLNNSNRIHYIFAHGSRSIDCHLSVDGADGLQQALELALLGLEVRVAANVFAADVDVGDGALARDLLEGVLDGGAVVDLVELDGEVLGTHVV